MRLLDVDLLPGLAFPMLHEGGVVLGIKLTGGVVRHIEQGLRRLRIEHATQARQRDGTQKLDKVTKLFHILDSQETSLKLERIRFQ